jgi:hypothetical protein
MQTFVRQADLGAPEMGDAAAALLDQVVRRQFPDRVVVHAHEAGPHTVDGPVDQNEG